MLDTDGHVLDSYQGPHFNTRTGFGGVTIVGSSLYIVGAPAPGADGDRIHVLSTVCGDGHLGPAEQCDDGNTLAGDCCSSTCQYEGSGSPCDDATVCNGNETCNGAGACLPGTPLNCDDGNACTADSCDQVGGCVNDDTPATGCLTANGNSLLLKHDATDDTRDKLIWKWVNGDAFDQAALADPTTITSYALCVYAGPTNALIASAVVPPGPSWGATGTKGYKFKGSSPNGISLVLLKGGDPGKSKALAKGKGTALPDPMLPVTYPVTAQLRKVGSPLCLESAFYPVTVRKNSDRMFKAKY